MSEPLPDYYAILEVSPTATAEQIRTAYKKAALKWHPDRVPADSPERPKRTKKFQAINDAYYTLSETRRRREYDDARKWHTDTGAGTSTFDSEEEADEEVPRTGSKGFPWNFFSGGTPEQDFANAQFSGAFEEMMADEGLAEEQNGRQVPTKRFWSILGAVSGGVLGFIVGNVIGAGTGAVAGHQLGSIRDKKGKSVYEVFNELDQNQKARVLTELAAKIFRGAIS